jgi:uncharacterized protein (UPF0276 family)
MAWPKLGSGIGLRTPHYQEILEGNPRVDWFEAVTENFMDSGGRPVRVLEEIRRRYPVALHGVALSIGSADPLDKGYLDRLAALVKRIDPVIVSDHLCWSGVDGEALHDLLPLPFTEEAINYIAARVREVQDKLGRAILLENVSTYVTYKHSVMPEWEFLSEVARRSGCGVLLDLNNVYVNSVNHQFDASEYVCRIPARIVAQFHLGGHTDMGDFLFDTHSAEVIDPVWKLYQEALARFGPVSTLIEWDESIPDLSKLIAEADKARVIQSRYADVVISENETVSAAHVSSANAVPLREAQRSMKDAILPGRKTESVAKLLNPQGNVQGGERMSVYAGGYIARIKESLGEVYGGIRHILGEGAFISLAADYARAYPSRDYNLNHAGKNLAEHARSSDWAARFPFLPDLALLEWGVARAFHANQPDAFDPASLVSVAEDEWGNVVFECQPSVTVVSSQWPVVDIWKARKAPLSELNVDLVGRPQAAVIYRHGLDVHCDALTDPESVFLSALFEGKTLDQACEAVAPVNAEPPVGDWLAAWTAKGLFRAVTIKNTVC